MKIGFIGCGNMATAIINGITNNNVVSEKDINAYDVFDGATKKLKENKDINICENEKDVCKIKRHYFSCSQAKCSGKRIKSN